MKVWIKRKLVDVVDEDCPFRSCYALGFDKGSFTPGVGYTSYHKVERPVCWTRHLNGCPHRDPEDGVEKIYEDGSVLVALKDPDPCCDNPDVPDNPRAYTQTCRSCGARLRGRRLGIACGEPDGLLRVVRSGDRWVPAPVLS